MKSLLTSPSLPQLFHVLEKSLGSGPLNLVCKFFYFINSAKTFKGCNGTEWKVLDE